LVDSGFTVLQFGLSGNSFDTVIKIKNKTMKKRVKPESKKLENSELSKHVWKEGDIVDVTQDNYTKLTAWLADMC
jgi:hypothetical protein